MTHNPVSENLTKEIVKDFIRQAIHEFKALLPPEYHSWQNTIISRNHGDFSYQKSTRPEISFMLVSFYDKGKLPCVKNFTSQLANDIRFQEISDCFKIPDHFGMLVEPINRIPLLLILHDYFSLMNQIRYTEEIADIIATNFICSLETKQFTITYCSVISGMDCEFESCSIDEEITLRKLADSETALLIDQFPFLIENDFIGNNQWIVEKSITTSFRDSASHQVVLNTLTNILNEFDRLITVLRILNEGLVDRISLVSKRAPGSIVNLQFLSSSYKRKYNQFLFRQYFLPQSDTPDLQILYGLLKNASLPDKIKLAIDRVNFASERSNPDDKIIDLMIAAESLFGGSGTTEVLFKLSMRCAKFLGNTLEERKNINKDIKNAYERRSAIVHGAVLKEKDKPTIEIVNELNHYIRKSITMMLKQITNDPQNKFDDSYFNDLLLS